MPLNRTSLIMIGFITLSLLASLELVSFLLLKIYYNRTIPKDTIELKKFGNTNGLKPNLRTTVWGEAFSTDKYGSRPQKKATNKPRKIWIGDSVLEGLGVADSSIFTSRLQEQDTAFDYLNFSHAGNSIDDYVNMVNAMTDTTSYIKPIEINIALCLNDIYKGELPVNSSRPKFIQRINGFLQHVHLYKIIKLFVYSNSDFYFQHDLMLYKNESNVRYLIDRLVQINNVCKHHHVACKVFLFPYRSQLESKNYFPQQTIAYHLGINGVPFFDLLSEMKMETDASKLYLFADEIHFSEKGHAAIAAALMKNKESK